MIAISPEVLREKWSARASQYAKRLVRALGREGAHRAIDAMLGKMSNLELAAQVMDPTIWLRSKQLPPPGDWVTWGKLEARGTGKTTAFASFITEEVQAGRAKSIGLAAQNETKTIEVQVGSLIKAAPPWFQPEWVASALQLRWPNGAVAFARTPEVPGVIRSENHELSWLSEVQSWPASTMAEALANFDFATRVGYARILWDANPKRGHPILKRWLAESAADPAHYVITRGTIYENPFIAKAALAKLEMQYAGTQKGREELLGEMLDDSEASLWSQAWIDRSRRPMPDRLLRRLVSVDPAVTKRNGSHTTGIIDAGLGVDGQMLVFADRSGKHAPHEWGGIVIDLHESGECDCVVVETNKGGDLVAANVKAHADKKKLNVVVLGKGETPRRQRGVLFIKEVHARGSKADRAQPLATAYERGRVSHVIGADLTSLEETLTTWEPGASGYSPGDLDALVHAGTELLSLVENTADARESFRGIEKVAEAIAMPHRATGLVPLLGGSSGGRI